MPCGYLAIRGVPPSVLDEQPATPGPLAPALSRDQARRLRASVRSLLEALGQIELALDPAGDDEQFPLTVADLSEDEQSMLCSRAAALRTEVASLATDFDVVPSPLSGRRQVVAQASYAWTVAEGLHPSRFRGMGELSPLLAERLAERVERLANEFRALADAAAIRSDGNCRADPSS